MNGPEPKASLLHSLIASDLDLDAAFSRVADEAAPAEEVTVVRAMIPGEALSNSDALPELLNSVLAEYEEIDHLLQSLHEHEATPAAPLPRPSVATFSAAELGSQPAGLEQALVPLASEADRFEFLFTQAKLALDRLATYRLSRQPADDLVSSLRQQKNLRSIQVLVEFLRSLHQAADSFEALALPRPHIRDYLTHLYQMRDWKEMRRLVHVLESAVEKLPAV